VATGRWMKGVETFIPESAQDGRDSSKPIA